MSRSHFDLISKIPFISSTTHHLEKTYNNIKTGLRVLEIIKQEPNAKILYNGPYLKLSKIKKASTKMLESTDHFVSLLDNATYSRKNKKVYLSLTKQANAFKRSAENLVKQIHAL